MPMLIRRKQYEAVLRLGLKALKKQAPEIQPNNELAAKAMLYNYSSEAIGEIVFLQRKVSIYNAIHKLFSQA